MQPLYLATLTITTNCIVFSSKKGELQMANLTPEQIVEKQIRNARNAVGDYRQGVLQTKKKPMERAKAKIQKMQDNFNRAVDDGTVAAGFDSVSDEEWKRLTSSKGGENYARGIEASKSKLLEFQKQRKSFQDMLSEQIDNMPTDTKEQRRARLDAQLEGMEQFRFQKRNIRRS